MAEGYLMRVAGEGWPRQSSTASYVVADVADRKGPFADKGVNYHKSTDHDSLVCVGGSGVGVGAGGDLPPSLLRHTSSKLNWLCHVYYQLIEDWKVANNLPCGLRAHNQCHSLTSHSRLTQV